MKHALILLLFLYFKAALAFTIHENLIVTTEQGSLQGSIRTDRKGGKFYSFTSIPYAKSPVGELRFKAPRPPELWSGILNATVEPPSCYHNKSSKVGSFIILGQEDCLYLNVFTRQLPDEGSTNKPVMVFIHGGGFQEGSSRTDLYGPEFLMTADIVLVTLNYRLGMLGFLSFDDESLEVPGNAGLKDQVMALKWVQKNIKYFGGNPKSVTLFGESAGSSSVEFHTLSPMSRGLFHRAIMQSGSALNVWNNGIRDTARIVGERLGINARTDKELLSILQQLPIEKINLTHDITIETLRGNAPIVERTSREPRFIPADPRKLLRKGKFARVPVMIGYTNNEGLLKQVFENQDGKSSEIDFSQYIPSNLHVSKQSDAAKQIVQRMKDFYMTNRDKKDGPMQAEIDVMTDTWFWYGIYCSMRYRLRAADSTIFLYRFTADTALNTFKRMNPVTAKHPGASHVDDLGYLFKNHRTPNITEGSIEDISIDRMVKLWTNFATYGSPTPDRKDSLLNVVWPVATKDILNYVEIGNKLSIGQNPDQKRIKFWDKIYQDFARH